MAEYVAPDLKNIRSSNEVNEPLCAVALVAAADAIISFAGLERAFTVEEVVELFPEGTAQLRQSGFQWCVVDCQRECKVTRMVWPRNRLVNDQGETLRDAGLSGVYGLAPACTAKGELKNGFSEDLANLANQYLTAAYESHPATD